MGYYEGDVKIIMIESNQYRCPEMMNSPVMEVNRGILRQNVILESFIIIFDFGVHVNLTLHVNMSVLNYGVHDILGK